jgi:hypothetical protein
MLEAVTDPTVCEKMYYIMERDFEQLTDPCTGGACNCRSVDDAIFVVNPLWEKLIWQESSQEIMARYSSAVFDTIEQLLRTEFIHAVKMHMVKVAYQEIFFFRMMNQAGVIFQTGFEHLQQHYNASRNLTNDEVVDLMTASNNALPATCGLSKYKISTCPFWARDTFGIVKTQLNVPLTFDSANYPSLSSWFNSSSVLSLFNYWGLPKMVGFAYCIGVTNFNADTGYTMMNSTDCAVIESEIFGSLYNASFGPGTNLTSDQKLGAQVMVRGILKFVFVNLYSTYSSSLYSLVYHEFGYTYEPVVCSPMGDLCMWQYGYMNRYHGSVEKLTSNMTMVLIDYRSNGNTQPNNVIYDENAGPMYNTYKYCSIVYVNPDHYDTCLNVSYTFNDALHNQPAGLWGVDHGISGVNTTLLYLAFNKESGSVKLRYQQFACNLTTLLFEVYPQMTKFHDIFVVKYINRYRDTDFTHQFNYDQWDDIAYAQWGGGFVTWAVAGVRSIQQILRNGPWVIGDQSYIEGLVEFGSWSLYTAFPQSWIYNVTQSRILLRALSRKDADGVAFKKHIIAVSTTFTGDGTLINGVGAVGEVVYVNQQNLGDFSCDGVMEEPCNILKTFYNSSSYWCNVVQQTYEDCLLEGFQGNHCKYWVECVVCVMKYLLANRSVRINCCFRDLQG